MTPASDDSAARPVDPDLTVVVTGVSATGAPAPATAGPSPTTAPAPTPSPVQQASSNVLPVGTQLAEFTVIGVIGEGGFGIVYRAHDRSLQRIVAVKEYMPSALASRLSDTSVVVKSEQHRETFEIGLKSFINEARLLAQFDHPALVKVFRFWAANGTAYMAMPLYEGGTLKQALKAMAAPPDEAWLRKLLVPLLDAIELLHAADCLHRDIAPDNVLMGPGSTGDTPRPVLLDFGAARRVIGGQTQALTVILKPGYAPIEQYDEIPGMKQGPWTDLYALGAVIHTAITGKPPPPSVGRLIHDAWVPLSQVAAGRYSAPFLAAIDAVLASRPDSRPRNVAQWRAMLAGSDGAAARQPTP
jgi:serine/threonine protein kinase